METEIEVLTGVCLWFNEARNFGFCRANDKDYFIHGSELLDGVPPIADDKITFVPALRHGKPVAKSVRIVQI